MMNQLDAKSILEQIWRHSIDHFWLCKPIEGDDFEICDFNPSGKEFMGALPSGTRLKHILMEAGESLEGYIRCLHSGETVRFEQTPLIQGRKHLFETLLIPIKNEEGAVIYMIGTSRNLAHQYEAEQRLLKLNAILGEKIVAAEHTLSELLIILEARVQAEIQEYIHIQEEKDTLAKLSEYHHENASKDMLTGLYNRRKLDEMLAHHTRENCPFAVLLVDIDHFKHINDRYGHLIGDEVLKELSTLMGDCIRPKDLFVRWGGEEFVILCPDTLPKEALQIAETLRHKVEKHLFETVGHVSVSIGVSASGDHEIDVLAYADRALYRAKERGRNRIIFESWRDPIEENIP